MGGSGGLCDFVEEVGFCGQQDCVLRCAWLELMHQMYLVFYHLVNPFFFQILLIRSSLEFFQIYHP